MKTPLSLLQTVVRRALDEAQYGLMAVGAGLVSPMPPHKVALMAAHLQRYGPLGALAPIAALRYGDRTAILDELGSITFEQLNKHSNSVANAWRERGLQPGQGVAILARNHRGFHYAVFAAAKCGARIVLLNTEFAGPQIREVAQREGTDLLVFDDEYAELLADIEPQHGRWRAWADTPGLDTLEACVALQSPSHPPKPSVAPKIILLTSGTTGTPKGAPRAEPKSLAALGAILSKVPFKAQEVTECPAPLFHTLGFAHAMLAAGFGSTLVVRRKFDPKLTLQSLARNRATAMIVVPVMLQRMLDLGDEARDGLDLSSLRIIFVAGSQLGAPLADRTLAAFGPVLYNLYGSTEVAYATIATPADLAAEPGCVGGVVSGAVVKILDESGEEVPQGEVGRIFVGNTIQFEGYTGGGGKEIIDGLMSSGDVGHFDPAGRLFIDGRDDDMIVSGGENVFPGEVEELLSDHVAVEECSVVGVDDEKYGQRLKAFVVVRAGAELSEDDVKEHVRAHLARFKTPREVVFLDELPRNATGKVLKRELR
ncbi:acyl-CoA synthetase [Antrihabitans sp. YC2-6]|uniref:acyl-CoA synthetase n=1 Tax=Antrihabitans sp. YC2-6 TaxID=2799498 RepID=UPI0018F375BA|nr:acyl-CoA synthetase [Antrihabitans sp. YC2-6]MBJ8343313.1 acyl-CoA synthetase [Antrihabitans sp. YC2-6]